MMETVSFVVRLESSGGLNLTMWRWYWFILWPTGTTPPSASKMITSMEVAAAAAAAAAAEVAAEVEWWRAEVAVTEVVRRTR